MHRNETLLQLQYCKIELCMDNIDNTHLPIHVTQARNWGTGKSWTSTMMAEELNAASVRKLKISQRWWLQQSPPRWYSGAKPPMLELGRGCSQSCQNVWWKRHYRVARWRWMWGVHSHTCVWWKTLQNGEAEVVSKSSMLEQIYFF